jgi:TonB family protein
VWVWLFSGAVSVVDPVYPPYAIGGGTVVAQVTVAGGAVKKIGFLSGTEPFVSSCKDALARWSLLSDSNGRELIVVHFRSPQVYSTGGVEQRIGYSKQAESLPYPRRVVEPAYPPMGSGQGSVTLRADISADGRVAGLRVVKSLGAFTEMSMDAVRRWEFVPARDSRDKATASHTYVVLVFRSPVMRP